MTNHVITKIHAKWQTCLAAVIISLLPVVCFAQSSGGTSGKEKEIIKNAQAEWQQGHFGKSFNLFKQAVVINPQNTYTNFRVGEIYFLSDSAKIKSLPYLRNAIKYSPSNSQDSAIMAYYYLGYCYELEEQYDSAAYCFKKYRADLINDKSNEAALAEIDQNLQICNMAPGILKQTPDSTADLINGKSRQTLTVANMGDSLNTKYPEYAQILFNNDSTISFTSRRPTKENPKTDDATGKYLEDIYESKKDKRGVWSTPVLYSHQIHLHEEELHTATVFMSADQKTLFSYRDGSILESKRVNGQWSAPVNISKNIPKLKGAYVPSIFLSNDGKKLILVTDMAGGYGGRDIYMCTLDTAGNWSDPQNLGPDINTAEDEDGPFLLPDNKTLFFSSKGHGGLGGYDIFVSKYDNGKWSTPINLGPPINSPGDDIFFTYKDYEGYFSSSRLGGYGDLDIYSYDIEPKPPKIDTAKVDTFNNIGANAAAMKTLKLNCTIYFQLAKYDLNKKYYPRLDSVVALLKANKRLKISVNGYTCSLGDEMYNKDLSVLRASAIAKYFYHHGVKFERVVYKGFGKTHYVAPNDGKHNYLNRRVEVFSLMK